MIEIHRPSAGRFRAACRRCVVGRPRGPSPPVVVTRSDEGTTFFCGLGEVGIALRASPGGPSEQIVIPMSLLEEIESSREGLAQIETNGRCVWDKGESTWSPVEATESIRSWDLPKTTKAVAPALLAALHECGRSAARESVRFATSKLQVQGKAGSIAGTDGRQLLLWSGFRFPFAESVLITAVPVFGARELVGEDDVRVGRSEHHIVVTAGPWTIWLAADNEGRFPNVASVVPKSSSTEVEIDEKDRQDAMEFVRQVGKRDDIATVTVDVKRKVVLRGFLDDSDRVSDLQLRRSSCSGDAVTVVLNRDQLLRALSLGFGRVGISAPNAPIVFHDETRSYVVTTLQPSQAIPHQREQPSAAARESQSFPRPFTPGETMPTETNGRGATEHSADPVDFMAEAEGLRDALADVARRAARLVGSLKQLQKQRRVLESAWSSLKNLRLGS